MTEPSEAAKRRACEILQLDYTLYIHDEFSAVRDDAIIRLSCHLDAEDKAARKAVNRDSRGHDTALEELIVRHILPDPKPTAWDILEKLYPGNFSPDEARNIAEALRAVEGYGL